MCVRKRERESTLLQREAASMLQGWPWSMRLSLIPTANAEKYLVTDTPARPHRKQEFSSGRQRHSTMTLRQVEWVRVQSLQGSELGLDRAIGGGAAACELQLRAQAVELLVPGGQLDGVLSLQLLDL